MRRRLIAANPGQLGKLVTNACYKLWSQFNFWRHIDAAFEPKNWTKLTRRSTELNYEKNSKLKRILSLCNSTMIYLVKYFWSKTILFEFFYKKWRLLINIDIILQRSVKRRIPFFDAPSKKTYFFRSDNLNVKC